MKYYIFCISLFYFTTAASQGWQHTFGGPGIDRFNDILQTSDGGYIAVGYTTSYGSGSYTTSYGSGNGDVYVVKTDTLGKMVWQQVIGGAGYDCGYSIVQNAQGYYYIAGETNSSGAGGKDIYLIKLDQTGSVIWTKTFGGTNDETAVDMELTSSGSIVIGGTKRIPGFSNTDYNLIKVNSSGNLLWSKTYGGTAEETLYGICKLYDGGFILTGRLDIPAAWKAYYLRTNSSGDTLWTRTVSLGTFGYYTDVVEVPAKNGFIMTGRSGSYYTYPYLAKFDLNANLLDSYLSPSYSFAGEKIISNSEGGYITSGSLFNTTCTPILFEFDSLLKPSYYRSFLFGSTGTYSTSSAIEETTDEGFILSGHTNLTDKDYDGLIIKTDQEGRTPYYNHPVTINGSQTFCHGDSTYISVDTGYTTYQWMRCLNSSSLSEWLADGTHAGYWVKERGTYFCIMTDDDGVYTSTQAAFKIDSFPTINIVPSGQMNFCYASGVKQLKAITNNGYYFQWKLNGINIPGATRDSLTPSVSGAYSVATGNYCDSVVSSSVLVDINAGPQAGISSASQFISQLDRFGKFCKGPDLVASAAAGDSCRWFLNGNLIYGAVNDSLPTDTPGTYQVIVFNACGADTSAPLILKADTIPFSRIVAISPTSGCYSYPASLLVPSGYSAYQWYRNDTLIPSANGYSYNANTNGFYDCAVTGYCNGEFVTYRLDGLQVALINAQPPAIAPGGVLTLCSGSALFNATGGGNAFQWTKDTVPIPGATGATLIANSTGDYRCYITTLACGVHYSNDTYLQMGSPSGTISATSTTICSPGSGVMLNANFPSNGTTTFVKWRRNGAAIANSNNNYYVATQPGVYDLLMFNSCGPALSNAITISSYNASQVTLNPSGNIYFCKGDSVRLKASSIPGATYKWYHNNTAITGAIDSIFYADSSGGYYADVTIGNCIYHAWNANLNFSKPVTDYIWPSTTSLLCVTGTVRLNAVTPPGATYHWRMNNTLIPGANKKYYVASAAGNYSVDITDSLGCPSKSSDFYVADKTIDNFVIKASGPTTFCSGGSVTLNSGASASNYKWSKNYIPISGATGNTFTTNTSGHYSLNITNTQGCTGVASMEVFSNPYPVINPQIGNPSCGNTNGYIVVYVNTTIGITSYQWSDGSTFGASRNNLPLGTYTVTVTDYFDCSASAAITLSDTLTATIHANGTGVFCSGDSITLTAISNGATTYQWYKNNNIIPGANAATYKAKTTGNYHVSVTNPACGFATNSLPFQVTVNPKPTPSVTPGGPVSFCIGGQVSLSTANNIGNTYQWLKNNIAITNALQATYIAISTGQYKVSETTANGCSAVSQAISVLTNPLPPAYITPAGPTTFCLGSSVRLRANTGTGLTHMWIKNNVFLNGSNGKDYIAKNAGAYKVNVTNANGCQAISAPVVVTVPCREDDDLMTKSELTMDVFPNPASEMIKINIHGMDTDRVEFMLYDLSGNCITQETIFSCSFQLNLSSLSQGIYILEVLTGGKKLLEKISVVK